MKISKTATKVTKDNKIVTLGLKPTYPATGFGYIECENKAYLEKENHEVFPVKGFREKPDEKTAKDFIEKGSFFWNSGMFIFKIETMINAFEKHMPELWDGISKIKSDLSNLEEVFPSLPSESIDYGVMEKVKEQVNI